jgi:hypothetical protein
MKPIDLTKERCGELIELTAANDAIAKRLEADLLAVKVNDKKIAALLAIRRAYMIAAGKRTGTRHGVEFKLIDKPGSVSWKGEVESLKGPEYAALVAANAPTVTKIEYKVAA